MPNTQEKIKRRYRKKYKKRVCVFPQKENASGVCVKYDTLEIILPHFEFARIHPKTYIISLILYYKF